MSEVIHRCFADLSTMAKVAEAKVEAVVDAVEVEAEALISEAEAAVGIEEPVLDSPVDSEVEPEAPAEPEVTK